MSAAVSTTAITVAPNPDELVVVGRAQEARIWRVAALVVAILAVLSSDDGWRPRLTPAPEGSVVQFDLPADRPVFSRFTIVAVDRNGPAVALFGSGRFPPSASAKSRSAITFLQ
jgi:hypothetical protein